MWNPCVLVAEDDPVVMKLLLALLDELDCRSLGVSDGWVAWEHVQAGERVDLVLTDVTMPRMDGLALTRALSRLRPDLPVLVMSGDEGNRELALRAGARDFLLKPFGWCELSGALRRVPPRVCASLVARAARVGGIARARGG